jgi:hypothetical protein
MDFVEKTLGYLVEHYALYMVVMMGVLIMIMNTILMLVKKPIKCWTGKIHNEKIRKLANKMFILFAFGLSALLWFVLNKISATYFPYDEIKVLLTGAFSIVIYALGDGIINTKKAKELVEEVMEVVEDKDETAEKKDTAVDKFWNAVKK